MNTRRIPKPMANELTVRVQSPVVPAIVWNEDEVKAYITEKLAKYEGLVYTADNIKSAKEDRADINKLKKQLHDSTIALKKYLAKPGEDFNEKIRGYEDMCSQAVEHIDVQVKGVEDAEKEDKRKALQEVYDANIDELAPLIPFERLFVAQWLNKSYSLKKASDDLRDAIGNIRNDLQFIRETCGEDVEACQTEYLRTLSVNDAVREHNRRVEAREKLRESEAMRAAAEKVKAASPVVVPPTREEREAQAKAAEAAQARACITPDGRLDFEAMRSMVTPKPAAQTRRKYLFWVEFTEADIEWFRKGKEERGFRYGPIEQSK